jgi:hypothetical protein
MDNLRPQSYALKSLELSPDAQREEGHHALRCVPLLSLKLSLPLRGLCWRRAPLWPGGQPPGPRLRSTAPQTPWYFWKSALAEKFCGE